MNSYRLNRLFDARSGRCLNVAVDHGLFGEPGFLSGIEDMARTVDTLVAAAPDAIQLSTGQARHLQARAGRHKPALVLRTDVANVYGRSLPASLFSLVSSEAVIQAVRLDAAAVVVNLFDIPGAPEVHKACVANVHTLKGACERFAMPLMVEPLVMKNNEPSGPYMSDGDVIKIVTLVRQAVELGADLIKADPTDDLDDYGRVIEAADVPVLVRGGGKVSDRELLARTRSVIDAGAAGVVYGRNIIQHRFPPAMTRALMAVVHDGAEPDEALELTKAAP